MYSFQYVSTNLYTKFGIYFLWMNMLLKHGNAGTHFAKQSLPELFKLMQTYWNTSLDILELT